MATKPYKPIRWRGDVYSIWFQKKGQHKGIGRKPELKVGNQAIMERFIKGLRAFRFENGDKYLATWGKAGY